MPELNLATWKNINKMPNAPISAATFEKLLAEYPKFLKTVHDLQTKKAPKGDVKNAAIAVDHNCAQMLSQIEALEKSAKGKVQEALKDYHTKLKGTEAAMKKTIQAS